MDSPDPPHSPPKAVQGGPLRWAHGLTIAFVALQYALDWRCPLTVAENALTGRPLDTEWLGELSGHGPLVASLVTVYVLLSLYAHGLAWRRPEHA